MEEVIVIKINKTHDAQRVSHSENKCVFFQIEERRRGICFPDFVFLFLLLLFLGGGGGGRVVFELGGRVRKSPESNPFCVCVCVWFFTDSIWNR